MKLFNRKPKIKAETNDLLRAVLLNDQNTAIRAVANGAEINFQTKKGVTPLLLAVAEKSTLVEFLLNNGADANLRDDQGNTPLIIAAKVDNVSAVQMLIARGAKVGMMNLDGNTEEEYASEEVKRILGIEQSSNELKGAQRSALEDKGKVAEIIDDLNTDLRTE
ncbi:MAG: ankyrin repeat domain-containing protein [Candidatus Micrarchaeota archaeon]|nr:ankyrin repeat domain-containing protein [Candidatus Micrarchaeota archaeon]